MYCEFRIVCATGASASGTRRTVELTGILIRFPRELVICVSRSRAASRSVESTRALLVIRLPVDGSRVSGAVFAVTNSARPVEAPGPCRT